MIIKLHKVTPELSGIFGCTLVTQSVSQFQMDHNEFMVSAVFIMLINVARIR
jgi:hypothetical protein